MDVRGILHGLRRALGRSGVTAFEYALIGSLVSIVIASALRSANVSLVRIFTTISNAL